MTELRVGLIVPLPEEFGYVSSVVDLLGDFREEGRVYHSFLIPGTEITGLLTVLHDMGQSNAAIAAQDLIRVFGVPLVALIGTGAALSSEVALGDVVVASEIDAYLYRAKAVGDAEHPGGPGLALAGTSWKPSAPLLDLVRNFPLRKASRGLVTAWSRDALARCPLPVGLRPAAGPGLHVAPVATGDVVVGSDAFKEVIRNKNRTLAAVEMEAGGAALSTYHSDTADVLVVRGISDHAAKDKTATDLTPDVDGRPNAWRRYAATNATRILLKLLAAPDFPWRATSPARSPVNPAPLRRPESGPSLGDGAESGPAVDGRSADGRRSGKGWLDGRTVAAVTSGAATTLAVESLLHRRRDIEEALAAASTPPAPDAGSHTARTESADCSDGSDGGSHPSADLHP
ncbi:hypothetical protein R2B67_01055 [Streptomyces cyaneofuscatus]|uniref:5'-methylthioadenosine/S-adenosylhomocysteine nucleosidase family protein n=1 Tax=Streptomyces cyaneofuscatus TaxID=66883 RepID=UPI0029547AA0|nr:hypothetical protein [Streptomyces cyaneofuscatus]WOP07202.1 hypothetical protein R2B67_01055 [Streptomyces cyaneofuscatus]